MNRTKRTARQAGFTMVEVMVAVLLTAIATSGIIALYMVQTRSAGFSRHSTEATILAQDKLEELRTIAGVPADGTETGINEIGGTGIFTRTWTATPAGSPAGTFVDFEVIVDWREDGIDRSLTMRGKK